MCTNPSIDRTGKKKDTYYTVLKNKLPVRMQRNGRFSLGKDCPGGRIGEHPLPFVHTWGVSAMATRWYAHRARFECHTAAAVEHLTRWHSGPHHLRSAEDRWWAVGVSRAGVRWECQEGRQGT
ncbi:hypothetical protein TNCV_60271 [Trichonephila clavipes]|nr:hypothetical protein TNCV_60271 [Trichonephila clavipes]